MRVLILDDCPMFRVGMRQIMAQLGKQMKMEVEVYEAENVAEAVNIADKGELDAAFVDVKLRDEDGFSFVNRAEQLHTNIRYIIMSEEGRYSDICRAGECGVSGLIIKNISLEEVIYAIRTVLRGGKYFSPGCSSGLGDSCEKRLTRREREVLRLLREGKTNLEIGRELFISEATTKKHVSSILGKLGLKNRVEAALSES